MKLLLARHGQSRWQVEGEVAGTDAPLTPLGEMQAHRLGQFLAARQPVAALYSSSLQRARRTAEIVAGYVSLPLNVDPDLCEFDDWEAGWVPYPVSMWDLALRDGELTPGYTAFRARVAEALRRIVAQHEAADAPVLLVAHGGTIGTIARLLMGSDIPRLWASNTALHLFEWNHPRIGESWLIHYLNRMEHLPGFMRTS